MKCMVNLPNLTSLTNKYMVKDFCPKGHKWIFVSASLLSDDYFYCAECDKIYGITVKEIPKKWFDKNYNTDRFGRMKELALIKEARTKVTKDDLVKLGYFP